MASGSVSRRPRRGLHVAVAVLAAALPLAGCAEAVQPVPGEVRVDTGPIGNIMPGSRHFLAWPAAHERCGAEGKSPELYDLQGPIVTYRCVKE
jgi:hypothetical protein